LRNERRIGDDGEGALLCQLLRKENCRGSAVDEQAVAGLEEFGGSPAYPYFLQPGICPSYSQRTFLSGLGGRGATVYLAQKSILGEQRQIAPNRFARRVKAFGELINRDPDRLVQQFKNSAPSFLWFHFKSLLPI
jgi:hypothetical protein